MIVYTLLFERRRFLEKNENEKIQIKLDLQFLVEKEKSM